MYLAVLIIHSWMRYVVLGLGLWLLIVSFRGWRAGRAWSPASNRIHVRFLAALDTQLLLGLSLYFVLSPISAAALANIGAAMKVAPLRFFGMEHLVTMLLAIIVAHVGRVRAKRKPEVARYRTVFMTQVAWLILTLLAIPWPFLDIGRPLFRM